jgi:ubiquinone/menaquinone biosynthesis C-methylase UbiE
VLTDRLERDPMLELLGDVAGRDILDVGCGDGELAVTLWERHGRVSGIDASEAMIEAARARAQARRRAEIEFEIARAEQLPFPPLASTSSSPSRFCASWRMRPVFPGTWRACFDRVGGW